MQRATAHGAAIMKIRVLGSGAGGGLPQWNCNCTNCCRARRRRDDVLPRTQSSIAVSDDGTNWILINASPDLLTQLRENPELQPARSIRDTGIVAVMLVDAQIDHVTGLLMMRERTSPLPLYATAPVFDDLSGGLPIVPLLGHYCDVERHEILPGEPFTIAPLKGVRFTAIPISSNAPPYSPRRDEPLPGDNIALLMENVTTGTRAFYAPGLGQVTPQVRDAMHAAQLVMVDGTFWSENEMIAHGLSSKRASEMGHLAQCGHDGKPGMVQWLDALPGTTRKVFIHINNTNPILDPHSAEYAVIRARGIEVARDGMHFQV
jgi:pyrroloquinoline quinone biosynthesis protein B